MTTGCTDICEKIHASALRLARDMGGVQIMEVCGTHTMAIARGGLRTILQPADIRLVSGPGCPVCVTDQSYIDRAVGLARNRPDIIVATYGDMVRVPGRQGSLSEARAVGARVEVVYSIQQALDLARQHADHEVVFLGVGFETTAPGTALAVRDARQEGLRNFSVLTAHKWVLPAMNALLAGGDVKIDAFLCPGHVSVILGYGAYDQIVRDYGRPCVVAGFDPQQVLLGVLEILDELSAGEPRAMTVYPSVSREGNARAREVLDEVFEVVDAPWRALGVIPASGMALRDEWAEFDAERRFDLPAEESYEMPGCRCGDVICGRLHPSECPLFARRCTVRDPVGPCMVSSEGACAAAFKYEMPARKR